MEGQASRKPARERPLRGSAGGEVVRKGRGAVEAVSIEEIRASRIAAPR
jgi:hypothetical protein